MFQFCCRSQLQTCIFYYQQNICVPMAAHFCKSGVIRPGTCSLLMYFILYRSSKGHELTYFFPLSSIYTPFLEDSCMQIKISLFFLHSLRVPKVIPRFGVFGAEAAPLL